MSQTLVTDQAAGETSVEPDEDGSSRGGLLSHDQIAEVAYFRWLRRGCVIGYDLHDWFEAERDLRNRR